MQEYAQASAELLAIQIDAAINPGMASICCSLGQQLSMSTLLFWFDRQ